MPGPEYTLTEKPIILYLQSLGYNWLKPHENPLAREGENHVVLKDLFISQLMEINGITHETAHSVYSEMVNIRDNERWTALLRGDYSRHVPGQKDKKTIRFIDFHDPPRNVFTVTNQFYVEAEKSRRPDVVCFVNGVPLVVIEAKSPVSFKSKMGEAFDQIKQYERDIPRLFYASLFNIITDGKGVLYGATGSPAAYWGQWKDPFPAKSGEFNGPFEMGLYSLLAPQRLLDILAHFTVFERDEKTSGIIKKVCRYQQFRAVNKITARVLEDRPPDERKGLIWHTQGSGKSLTMVFTVLKLKTHLTLSSPVLANPNILVVTDRIDLDEQIARTFTACGLPNPVRVGSKEGLLEQIHRKTKGLTLLSTIFKISGSTKPVADSGNWIICTDESHRTQERNLGAFLRATFPDAHFFGFTGTPIQNSDHDTYANFSPRGELYLDKYSIDDAVADGATVPIHYTSRKAEWHLEAQKLDILFDQWFAHLPDDKREELKKKGLSLAALAKHPKRVELIAYDLWTHFLKSAKLDGFKAQIVAIDREAVILYKRALDDLITRQLIEEGVPRQEAEARAGAMSVPVYSPNQEDNKPSEDPHIRGIREDLVRYQLAPGDGKGSRGQKNGAPTEKEVKKAFKIKNRPPWFLIVCSKLLTGFDAPCESVMYLDSPLKEHTLLQAIARTNRVEGPEKQNGLIVDYIGVTKHLKEALSSYRKEDIRNALADLDELRKELEAAHRQVMEYITIKRGTDDPKAEYAALWKKLATLDLWLLYKQKAQGFIKAYEALCPDPHVLKFMGDLKWIAASIPLGTAHFEKEEAPSLENYSGKIREMLEKHLKVTGITTLIKLRRLTDPEFFEEFRTDDKSEEEIERAAVKKATELKKIIKEKIEENPRRYGPFSQQVQELIARFEQGQLEAADLIKEFEQMARDLNSEETAHKKTGLSQKAYGVYKILQSFQPPAEGPESTHETGGEPKPEYGAELSKLKQLAKDIEELYSSPQTAPTGWSAKEGLKKELRKLVRRLILPAGLEDWKRIPKEVEQYAIKHYGKGQ